MYATNATNMSVASVPHPGAQIGHASMCSLQVWEFGALFPSPPSPPPLTVMGAVQEVDCYIQWELST
jgi:hypothetical protein